MHVFDDQVIVISVPDDGNHVLYAFKEQYFEPRWRWLHSFAKELRASQYDGSLIIVRDGKVTAKAVPSPCK